MKLIALALVAIGALFFPFAAKQLVLRWSEGGIGSPILMMVIGAVLIAAGELVARRDDATSQWRDRSRGKRRLRLRS